MRVFVRSMFNFCAPFFQRFDHDANYIIWFIIMYRYNVHENVIETAAVAPSIITIWQYEIVSSILTNYFCWL